VWSYWWVDEIGRTGGKCRDWQFTYPATIQAWHSIEVS
jgi:hypothetical protein